MKRSSHVIILSLLLTILVAVNLSTSEGKQLSELPLPQPAPTVTAVSSRQRIDELQATFDRLDTVADKKESDVKVKVKGNTEATGQVVIELKDKESANAFPEFAEDQYVIDLSLLDIPETFIFETIRAIFLNQSKVGSLDGVKVKQIGATANYEVVEDYSYQSGTAKITVPKGFVYDRASIPRFFWVIIDKDSLSNVAPLFHDLLYRNGGRLEQRLVAPYRTFSREETDKLFLELMEKCGVDTFRRKAAYQAVRRFAASSWQRR